MKETSKLIQNSHSLYFLIPHHIVERYHLDKGNVLYEIKENQMIVDLVGSADGDLSQALKLIQQRPEKQAFTVHELAHAMFHSTNADAVNRCKAAIVALVKTNIRVVFDRDSNRVYYKHKLEE